MAARAAWAPPKIAQLAFCTSDLPGSVRLYSEAFGFAPAGGNMVWGQWLADIQGLGEDAATAIAWLVGRQDLLQLEFFNHTLPRPRPLAADWRPSDLGWVRWGLTIPDFEAALDRLHGLRVSTMTDPQNHDGLRRVCFRDPGTGIVVEVMEEGSGLPGGVRPRYYDLAPGVVYATLSVPDLEEARSFYLDTLGLVEEDVTLHTPEMESLWGLSEARGDSFVARGGDVYLEVVHYTDPVGRPRPDGYRLSDQGFMNIAVGTRVRAESEAIIEQVRAAGHRINAELPGVAAGGTYMNDGSGNSLEVICAPREFDSTFGFAPTPQLLRPPGWPSDTVAPAAPAPAGR
jgi:catechol 2,3-dioxygenase-like lactoylglutathione lyase family enzyme